MADDAHKKLAMLIIGKLKKPSKDEGEAEESDTAPDHDEDESSDDMEPFHAVAGDLADALGIHDADVEKLAEVLSHLKSIFGRD